MSDNIIEELKHLKLAIFDLDGVIYRGNDLIPNVAEIIKKLKALSIEVVYNSNNSTATREMYVNRLTGFKIDCKLEDFYTSASITASEITKLKKVSKIFIIGEIGLKMELEAQGHIIIHKGDAKNIDFVVVGLDRSFDYEKLAVAQFYILEKGAKFYATNSDSTLPVSERLMPGAGVMVNAVKTCTNLKPLKVFGKPNPYGIESILNERDFSPEEACIFGDRLNTDILAGNRANIKTIAVLTGVATRHQIDELKKNCSKNEVKMIPDLVIDTLDDIFTH
ncbi:MAG: HAD-IIA family hydrolase [Candidatus Lokiarchaeota archaeon]|nr:HAD-IIA family hydrolase [Candidatus Lokiarchaeota archaeon]MBD3199074.1 HAD-IIA family hydrolase [Candidatus Lokiarchaeota archaeon]